MTKPNRRHRTTRRRRNGRGRVIPPSLGITLGAALLLLSPPPPGWVLVSDTYDAPVRFFVANAAGSSIDADLNPNAAEDLLNEEEFVKAAAAAAAAAGASAQVGGSGGGVVATENSPQEEQQHHPGLSNHEGGSKQSGAAAGWRLPGERGTAAGGSSGAAASSNENASAIPFVPPAKKGGGGPILGAPAHESDDDSGVGDSNSIPVTADVMVEHVPPEGFVLTARVVTDPSDGHTYFVTPTADAATSSSSSDSEESLVIPFLECGTVGSTTPPIHLKSGSFRHFPSGAEPSVWSTAGPNPQLIVALHPVEITVSGNNNEKRTFDAGDVILLEDTVGKGHKMRAVPHVGLHGEILEEKDLSVLMLTLPHHYHPSPDAGGNSHHHHPLNLFGLNKKKFGTKHGRKNPCKNEVDPVYSTVIESTADGRGSGNSYNAANQITWGDEPLPMRKLILGGVGLILSSAVSYFLTKVAPYVLAVGFGGVCSVGGGTYGCVVLGEKVLDELEMWRERRRFAKAVEDERNAVVIEEEGVEGDEDSELAEEIADDFLPVED